MVGSELHAEPSALQHLAAAQPFEQVVATVDRRREADAGVVPLDPGVASARRQRHRDAEHTAVHVDHRTAVVGRRRIGVDLQCTAEQALPRADDAEVHGRQVAGERAAECQRPLPDLHRRRIDELRCRQVAGVDLDQRDAAAGVLAGAFGVERAPPGHGDQDRRRLEGEREARHQDPAVAAQHDPGRAPAGLLESARDQRLLRRCRFGSRLAVRSRWSRLGRFRARRRPRTRLRLTVHRSFAALQLPRATERLDGHRERRGLLQRRRQHDLEMRELVRRRGPLGSDRQGREQDRQATPPCRAHLRGSAASSSSPCNTVVPRL